MLTAMKLISRSWFKLTRYLFENFVIVFCLRFVADESSNTCLFHWWKDCRSGSLVMMVFNFKLWLLVQNCSLCSVYLSCSCWMMMFQENAARLSPAEEIRTLLDQSVRGMLSTFSRVLTLFWSLVLLSLSPFGICYIAINLWRTLLAHLDLFFFYQSFALGWFLSLC